MKVKGYERRTLETPRTFFFAQLNLKKRHDLH